MPKTISKLRRILRVVGYTLLVLVAWISIIAGRVVYLGSEEGARKSDVIIVLGAAVRHGEPSPAFAGRIKHGIELYKKGLAPKMIFTGGLGHDGILPEAEIARRLALREGVPEGDVYIETVSTKTWENITESARIMREHGLQSAIIVSDPYHLHRARRMAEDAGISAVTSPTPYTAFQTWRAKIPFLLNEVRLYHTHMISRALNLR